MNSAVQLALMTKAKKVFGAENTFLSFPVSPLPFTRRDLDFFSQRDADDLRESQQNLLSFSTLVNLIPEDEAWLPTENVFLWDVYEQVLREADFAVSTRTPEEEAAYQRALAFLRVPGEGGVMMDSEPVRAYRQHKDAYLLAEQKYNADRFTGESASDPAEKQRWREVEEPAQRANLDDLRAQWITAGHKNEVEAAQARVVSLGARSPTLTWSEWNSRFNSEIDAMSGAVDTSTVYPSFYSPSNALDDDAWQPFKLSAEEVKALFEEAPAELRTRFAADSAAAANRALTFEFSSATIQRPWFASEAFRSRFWRFSDPSRVISDGGAPANGPCPAYVTAVVFARKVKEEEVKRPEPGRPTIPIRPTIGKFVGFQFTDALQNTQVRLRRRPPTMFRGGRAVLAANIARESQPQGEAESELSPKIAARRAAINPALMRPGVANKRPHLVLPAGTKPAANAGGPSNQLNFLHKMTFTRPVLVKRPTKIVLTTRPTRPIPTHPTTLPPPPPTPVTPPPVEDDSIYILAFICKSLPKCPDPDPTLQW